MSASRSRPDQYWSVPQPMIATASRQIFNADPVDTKIWQIAEPLTQKRIRIWNMAA
jgi:hypothetical protein